MRTKEPELLLTARSFKELHDRLPGIAALPRRAERDNTAELYPMARLLATIPLDLTDFPLELWTHDRPDCTLKLAGRSVGIEHTQVMSENAIREAKMRASQGRDACYFIRPATVGDPRKSKEDLQTEIEEDRMLPPMEGDSVERNWVEAIAHSVSTKVTSARKPNYRVHDQFWLALHDKWPAPALARERALRLLRDQLHSIEPFSVFEKIFILTGTLFVELTRDQIILRRLDRRRYA